MWCRSCGCMEGGRTTSTVGEDDLDEGGGTPAPEDGGSGKVTPVTPVTPE